MIYEFNLKGRSFKLEVEDSLNGFVNIIKYRPNKYIPQNNQNIFRGTVVFEMQKAEFINDLEFQLNFLRLIDGDITGDSFIQAALSACGNHINSFSRLIDNDLFTYIDINMHILYAMTHLPIDQMQQINSSCVGEIMSQFKDYIYINDPVMGLRKLKSH